MDKKISELDQALQINNDAVFPMSQDNSGTDTTYKASITQLSTEIGEGQTFSNLQTTSKNLVGAINELNQGGGGGGSSNANLAPDYDATSTYAVGDWCIYNGTLYQCNTAIPTAEAFDPTHWTAKKVVDAFADIEGELDDKVDTADFTADLLPIESGSSTNTKDYIDSGLSGESVTFTPDGTGISTNNTYVYRKGKILIFSIDVVFSSDYLSQWKDIGTVSDLTLDGSGYFGLITTENGDSTFIQVYQIGSELVLRGRNVKTFGGNNLRGQIVVPIV